MNKRRFVQLAGLSIAHRILPSWLWAGPFERPADSSRKVIMVTFGGGVRYSETFTLEGVRNIPYLAAMQPKGLFFKTCINSGVLSHFNSTAKHHNRQLAARGRFRIPAAGQSHDL